MNKINWFFVQWYFLIVKSTPVPDVTLVLQNLQYNYYNITCILSGANLNSGIAWIHPLSNDNEDSNTYVSKYVPALYNNYNCKIDGETCTFNWTNNYWNFRNSFFTNLDVVTDNRWEEFPVTYTDGKKEFYYVHELQNSEKHTISFSVRAENEAHIFLCNGKDPPKSSCYWILLGGFGGERIVIRKCMQYEIKNNFGAPSSDSTCKKQEKVVHRNADTFFNMDSWKHFTITINKNNLVLKSVSNNEVLSNYTDSAEAYIIITHLNVRTYTDVRAYWKFHNYDFTYTTTSTSITTTGVKLGPRIQIQDNTLCISLYAAMCSGCILIINAFNNIDNADISKQIVQPRNEYSWTEVKWNIISSRSNELDIVFYVETHCTNNCDQQFWAIDNFRICTDNEVRVLNVEGDPLKSSFQIVDSSFKNLIIKSTTPRPTDEVQYRKCPVKTIDSATCTTCTQVFGSANQFCEHSTICNYLSNEEGICTCSPGTTGKTCNTYCPEGFYGIDCKETCGLCHYAPCHFATGNCIPETMSCLSNFTDLQCKTPPYPILINAPNVISISNTYLTIQINNFSYNGMGKPATFKIRYEVTNDNSSWKETGLFAFNYANEITLHNLLSDTNYTIRVVLQTSEGQFYNGAAVPITYAKTHCADIQLKDIDVQPSNTSAILTFENKPELCSLKYYEIICNNYAVLEENDKQFYIRDLDPDTNYTLSIKNLNTSAVIYHTFRTKEGVSSTVLNMTIISSTATSLTISWEKPNQPHGQIKHYEINYKHHRYLACDDNDISNENTVSLQHQSTSITLESLRPYSQYIINVAAFTVVVGKFAEVRGITSPTGAIDKSEIPSNVGVEPSYDEAMIILKQPNCSCIKGDIAYYISALCTSDWCLNKTATLNRFYHDSRGGLKLTNLAPYSEYIMNIKVGRRNGNDHEMEELSPYTFKTKPTVPYSAEFDIYEESDNILRLRIVPPYPPTGELEKYFVRYHAKFYDSYLTEMVFDPVSCKIWTKHHCIDLTTNLRKNIVYRVFVQARNKNITELGNVTTQSERTAERNSHVPKELRHFWDNYYNLTLQWNHPDITNGPLTKFIISISKGREECYSYNYMVREETTNLTYNHTVSMENKNCYTSELAVDIAGYNIRKGDSGTLNIYSPPETPALNREPFAATVSNITITIAISAKMIDFPTSFMYIFLSQSKSKFEIDNSDDFLDKLESLETLPKSGFIRKYNLNTEIPMEQLTIGHNKSDSLQNDARSVRATLMPNTSYTITILLYNEYQGRKRYRVYEIVKSTTGTRTDLNGSSNTALFSLILLVFLIPLLFWIYIKKRKTGKWCSFFTNTPNMPFAFKPRVRRNPDVIPLTTSHGISTTEIIDPKPQIPLKNPSINLNVNKANGNTIIDKFSKPIKITDFDKYVKDAIKDGELERQHSLFVRGQTKPWDYGKLPQNKSKNRYNNLIAYDHTRVKLEKINDDPYSDYINANYIEGYKSKNSYIATQGPKVATVNDFWRMIWQDNVKYIVMLANVIEGGKKKTEQYWPNINETTQFGNISVKYISTVVSADYEYRTFLVTSNNTERQVEQLHFTSWPDHGVPMYSQSLVPLFRKLLTIPQGNSPIVVHCSAGVGRTGTVILCDLCLRMSAHEQVIDVLKHQRNIREQRANLVDNLEQYKLVHLVLLECLINPDTSITCDEKAEKNILNLLETERLENQFQYISEIAWQDQAMRPSMEINQIPEWNQKNRVENIVASGYGRVYLARYPVTDEHSDYINAVEVDGFKAPKRFIATQQPLPNTISDFWRMIDEKEVSTIVSLNSINKENNRSCVFWPTSKINEIQPVPYLLIKFINKISMEEITIVNIELHNKKDKEHTKRDINLIKLKNWPADQSVPNSNISLLNLWNEAEKVSQNKHPIVVTCHDGTTACGLFLAFTFVIEKIKLEHQCDVCLAVRTVRHNREQFVQELDQFKYLYRAAIEYLSCFELYSNFS